MPVTELFGNKLYWVRKFVAAYLFLLALNCLSYTYMESWEGHGLQLLMGRGIGKDIQEEKKQSVFDFLVSPREEGVQQIQCMLIICPPPRKSLVKGERFIRSEGRPELFRHCRCSLIYADGVRSTYGFRLISSARLQSIFISMNTNQVPMNTVITVHVVTPGILLRPGSCSEQSSSSTDPAETEKAREMLFVNQNKV